MGFPVFNVAATWDSVVVSDCVSAQAYKNVLLTCIQYSFDRSTRMDINTAMKRKIQVCMHVNIQVMYFCYLHTFFIVGYGRHCPQRCLNIRLQQDDLHKPMLPLPCQHTCPAQTQCQNAASPQEFLKIRMPSHASFLAMCFVYNEPSNKTSLVSGRCHFYEKTKLQRGMVSGPMLKAVLPHLQI